MIDVGHSWRQTTVAKTEAADRPIRVNEAAALAGVFGITINDLLTVPIDDYHLASATVRLSEARALAEAAKQRVNELERNRQQAEEQLAAAQQEYSRILDELKRAQEKYEVEVKSAEERSASG